MRAGLALAALCLAACASTPRGPFFSDEKYLRFGVQPDAEASALVHEREKLGDAVASRVVGQSFTALGFIDRNGDPVAVRVVTARGIALALDRTETALEKPTTFELLPPPLPSTQDADGDGFEEVFIAQERAGKRCLLVYRVRDVGFVDLVNVPVHVFGQDLCVTDLDDVNRDGHVELLATATLDGVSLPTQASVSVPLWASQHRFALDGDPAARTEWITSERTPRQLELDEARHTLDVRWALRMAFELAALSLLDGQDRAAQLRVFDGGLAGLVLDPNEQAAVLQARARIEQSWNPDPDSPRAQ